MIDKNLKHFFFSTLETQATTEMKHRNASDLGKITEIIFEISKESSRMYFKFSKVPFKRNEHFSDIEESHIRQFCGFIGITFEDLETKISKIFISLIFLNQEVIIRRILNDGQKLTDKL